MGGDGAVEAHLAVGDEAVHLGDQVVRLGIVVVGRLAEQQQSAGNLSFLIAEHALQQIAEGIFGRNLERLLQSGLGVLDLAVLVEQLRPCGPRPLGWSSAR